MTQQTLLLSPGTEDLARQLIDEGGVCIGPNAIDVSNEAGVLAANGFAQKDGPDLVLLDGPGLEEVLRAQNSAAKESAD